MANGPKICPACGRKANDRRGFRGKLGLCQKCAHKIHGKKMRKRIKVDCKKCGKVFELRPVEAKENGNYCSSDCYHSDARQRDIIVKRNCESCGQIFSIKNESHQRYCSVKCRYASRTYPVKTCIDCGIGLKHRNSKRCRSCAAKAIRPRKRKIIRYCKKCGKRSRHEYGYRGKRGLCRQCAAPVSGKKRRRRVKVTCPNCHEAFETEPNLAKKNDKNFCCKSCYSQWQAKNQTGENAHNWRGGAIEYYGPNWRQQQRLCRKMAGYECEICGKTKKENKRSLDVHHIKPFKSFNYIPGANENYLLANDLSNLMALCKSCHAKYEPRKGTIIKIPDKAGIFQLSLL